MVSQADNLRRALSNRAPKVLAVCSGKGGVGKTNVAANLAIALGRLGRNVCLLDADLSLANVDVLLGLQPSFNLSHVVAGDADLEATMMKGPGDIRIVPASSGSFSLTDLPAAAQASLIQMFGQLADQPDVLVVDTAAGISSGVARFVQAAQHPLVVIRDEPASLTDAYALVKVFSENYGVRRFQVVTNYSSNAAAGRQLFRKLSRVTDHFLDVVLKHIGDVPADRYVLRSVQEQRAVIEAYPLSPAGQAFRKLGQAVDALPTRREAGGGIEFFFERLLSADAGAQGRVA